MSYKVLVTDYVWPSLEPEREVLAAIGAELVPAPDGDEDTLVSMTRGVDAILTCGLDAILTCFAKVTENVVRGGRELRRRRALPAWG